MGKLFSKSNNTNDSKSQRNNNTFQYHDSWSRQTVLHVEPAESNGYVPSRTIGNNFSSASSSTAEPYKSVSRATTNPYSSVSRATADPYSSIYNANIDPYHSVSRATSSAYSSVSRGTAQPPGSVSSTAANSQYIHRINADSFGSMSRASVNSYNSASNHATQVTSYKPASSSTTIDRTYTSNYSSASISRPSSANSYDSVSKGTGNPFGLSSTSVLKQHSSVYASNSTTSASKPLHHAATQPTVDFYHYTDYTGLQGIKRTMYIKESKRDWLHARYGHGVYGTKLAPSCGKSKIAYNNWRGGGESNKRRGRADYAVMVRLPKDQVEEHYDGGRHIYAHSGIIYLDHYYHEFQAVNY